MSTPFADRDSVWEETCPDFLADESIIACDTASCGNGGVFRYWSVSDACTIFATATGVRFCNECWEAMHKALSHTVFCAACHKDLQQSYDTPVSGYNIGPIELVDKSGGDPMRGYKALNRIYHSSCGVVCDACCCFIVGTPSPQSKLPELEPDQVVCKGCLYGDGDSVVRSFVQRNAAIIVDSTRHPGKKRLIRPLSAGIRYAGTMRGVAAATKRANQLKREAQESQESCKRVAI